MRVAVFEGCVLGLTKHTVRGSCQWGRVLSATGDRWVWIGERIEVRMAWEASLLGQTPSSSIHRRLFVAWGLTHADQTDKAGL